MKSHLTFSIVLLLFSLEITAQWFQQTSGTTVNLQSVFFINANTGWACGGSGKIIKTTNGGLDWLEQNSNTTASLKSIQFIDADNGWACSADQILNTTDGGSTWNAQSFPPSGYISAFQFINLNEGWVLSHNANISYANKTTNGGINWNVKVQSQAEYFETLFFLDENTGWIPFGGTGGVLKTTDGGNSWMQYSANLSGSPMKIMFVDSITGWISHNTLGSYEISKSTDGGVTWFTQIAESFKFIHSINFPNSAIGYAVGWEMFIPPNPDEEFIIKTTDGGTNWIEQYRDDGVLNSVNFVNDTLGWTVGNGGKILTTDNGGVTSVEEKNSIILDNFTLYQNYPNPFNPSTTIKFTISDLRFTTLKVYDVLGNEVATLVNGEKPAGEYNVEFRIDNLELSSGIYFYRLQAGEYSNTKKMILLK